jgi:hypothetical protein
MRKEQRNAIGGARSHREARRPRNERVALRIGDYLRNVAFTNLAHVDSMHLPLFEQPFDGNIEHSSKAGAVLSHEFVAVAQMKTQIERVVGRLAHPTPSGGERVTKTVLVEESRTSHTHVVCVA